MRFECMSDDTEDLQLLFGLKGNRLIADIMWQESQDRTGLQLLHGKFTGDRRHHNIAMFSI